MHFLAALVLQVAAGYAYKKVREYIDKNDRELTPFREPTATEGRKTPIAYGLVPIKSPNFMWWGDLSEHTKSDVSEGVAPVRHFWIGLQMSLCRGVVDSVTNLWVDDIRFYRYKADFVDTPVYDLSWTSDGELNEVEARLDKSTIFSAAEGKYFARVRAYLGSDTQAVDTYLSGFQTPAPAYRGRCYLVWEGFTGRMSPQTIPGLGGYVRASGGVGASTSLRPFTAEVRRIVNVNPLGLAPAQRDVGTGGNHCNPMNVAADLITSSDTLNEATAAVDTANFTTAATTLATEGNGMSWLLDNEQDLTDILEEIERQINGFIFKDPASGKWVCKLARADYSIPSLTAVDQSNVSRLSSFRRTTWQGTVNQVNIKFESYDSDSEIWRDSTFARAHDIANFEIQGRYVPVDLEFPGLKDPALAADLATRELNARNRPLAHCELEGKRELSILKPGDVVRFSWGSPLNITDLPMRVIKTDYGEDGGPVNLFLVEDVFGHLAAVQGDPPNSDWEFPSSAPQAVPLDEGLVEEIPYAIAARGGTPEDLLDRVWFAAPQQTNEGEQRIYTREGADPYEPDGSSSGITIPEWIFIGTLDAILPANTAQPHTTPGEDVDVTGLGYPGSVSEITRTLSQLGENLDHLVMIGSELMLCRDIENVNDTTFTLKRVYRGALDTARQEHAASTDVFLMPFGADLRFTNTGHTQGSSTDLQFRPVTIDGELVEGSANTETVSLDHRGRRPYPPTDLNIEGTRYPTSAVSLDSTTASGSGVDEVGFDASWTRRDYRTFNQVNSALGTVQAGFPSADSTEYRVIVTEDPGGSPSTLITGAWDATGAAAQVVTRTDILAANDGVVPTGTPDDLRVAVETRHTFEGTVREALQSEQWDFDVTSAFIASFTGGNNTGAENDGVISAIMTATDTGTYTFTIGTDVLTGGAVLEARINGGSFSTVMSAGQTTGTLAGVTATNTIEWRHTQATGGVNTFLTIDGPTTSNDGYGILIT